MKIYRIEVKPEFIDYDDFTAIVVIAESPEQARSDAYNYVLKHGFIENAVYFVDCKKSVVKETPMIRSVIAAEDLNG